MEDVVDLNVHARESLWWPRFTKDEASPLKGLKGQRIILVGGTGWIGRAVQHLLQRIDCHVLIFGSPRGKLSRAWDLATAEAFGADGLVFLAGVTPDLGEQIGLRDYEGLLEDVSRTLEQCLEIRGLRWLSYASSGIVEMAELEDPHGCRNAYQSAKYREEALVECAQSPTLVSQIVRIYSLSGPFVTRPEHYAIFDLISQAKSGVIRVKAQSGVWRNYTAVTDLATVILSAALSVRNELLCTGGQPIEMRDLASLIARTVNPSAIVQFPPESGPPNFYCATGSEWERRCSAMSLISQTLDSQIRASALWLERYSG
jgi:nucleoside-diphosphate-sugar epimerase